MPQAGRPKRSRRLPKPVCALLTTCVSFAYVIRHDNAVACNRATPLCRDPGPRTGLRAAMNGYGNQGTEDNPKEPRGWIEYCNTQIYGTFQVCNNLFCKYYLLLC